MNFVVFDILIIFLNNSTCFSIHFKRFHNLKKLVLKMCHHLATFPRFWVAKWSELIVHEWKTTIWRRLAQILIHQRFSQNEGKNVKYRMICWGHASEVNYTRTCIQHYFELEVPAKYLSQLFDTIIKLYCAEFSVLVWVVFDSGKIFFSISDNSSLFMFHHHLIILSSSS